MRLYLCGAQNNNGKNESEFSVSLLSLLPYKARRTIWNVSPGLHHDFYFFSVTLSIENPMRRGSIQHQHPIETFHLSVFTLDRISHILLEFQFRSENNNNNQFGFRHIYIHFLDTSDVYSPYMASTAHSIQWERIDSVVLAVSSRLVRRVSHSHDQIYTWEIGLSRMCSRRRAFDRASVICCVYFATSTEQKIIFIRPVLMASRI